MIHFRSEVRGSAVNARALRRTALRLLEAAGLQNGSLSILLVDDGRMKEMNRLHRGKDVPTDVLSFPIEGSSGPAGRRGSPEQILGDVVISVDTAKRQAADYGAPLQNEVYRSLIHGL